MALRRQLREGDTLARIGGDEFAALLENTDVQQAAAVAHKLIEAVEQFRFAWQGFGYRLGASAGLIEFSGEGLEAEDVIEAADRMCYVAKESGRGRVATDVLRAVRPQHPTAAVRPVPATGRSVRSAGPASERRS
jgi:diguanylate cyclase (GGDEF)-like protein